MNVFRWILSLFSILRKARLKAEAKVDISLGCNTDSSSCTENGIRKISETERGVRRFKRNKERRKRLKGERGKEIK